MSEYIPIPTEVAKDIAERYQKSCVIICAHDPVHGMLHTTTFGSDPQNKEWAAYGGEIAARALGTLPLNVSFEDYRLDQARKLMLVVEEALALCGGWREAVVELEDHCSEPVRIKNMLVAADQIDGWKKNARVAVAEAKNFIQGLVL